VFALKSAFGGGARRGYSPREGVSESLVVPRFLRRPVRMLSRLDEIEMRIPRFAATGLSLALLAGFSIHGAYLGGYMPAVMQAVSARTGFAVTDIRVSGDEQTSEIDVLDQLQLNGWTALVGFNADAARERLMALPWVESATVRKIYPDAIEVAISERKPFAIWQHGDELTIIEADGKPIAPFDGRTGRDLPLVIGDGAPETAAAFVAEISAFPSLAGQIKAYNRVADRRWDVYLANGVRIKLPERDLDGAVQELLALDASQGILSRDVLSVDMRFSERLVVQLTPEAVERRTAQMEAEKKAAKKAGRQI
jgi:cell division protein FtsQ